MTKLSMWARGGSPMTRKSNTTSNCSTTPSKTKKEYSDCQSSYDMAATTNLTKSIGRRNSFGMTIECK